MASSQVRKLISSRIPTAEAEYTLCLYRGERDEKDHLALVLGDVAGQERVLVRIHSECFTGDVLGSRRCDCGEQLARATGMVADEGAGVLIYLRQEGRGIGLLDKLRAYNLQDDGHDTVEANRLLGHQADEREYDVAAAILRDLGVGSIRLLTNNPAKLESLERLGFSGGCVRVPLHTPVRRENAHYLQTKAKRMRHLLQLDLLAADNGAGEAATLRAAPLSPVAPRHGRPAVTLTYAQSLDGSITVRRGESLSLSGPESLVLTHRLRAQHDAILVGIETVLADDPRLNVRLVEGPDPLAVVLDSQLRIPLDAKLLQHAGQPPCIATTEEAGQDRQLALEAAGATVLRMPANDEGQVDLHALLPRLREMGVGSLMVEGGARVITSFLVARLVDRLVLTIAPLLVGGLSAVGSLAEHRHHGFPSLRNPRYQWLGNDLVLLGELDREPD